MAEVNKVGYQLTQQNDVNVSLGSFYDGVLRQQLGFP